MNLKDLTVIELIDEVNRAYKAMDDARREWNMACAELMSRKEVQ